MKERGNLTVIYGPMYAGKTTEIVNRKRSNPSGTQVFRANIDTRYSSDKVVSHDSESVEATSFDTDKPSEVIGKIHYDSVTTVIIDEIQFCTDEIIIVVDFLLSQGLNVVAVGLDLDSNKNEFGQTLELTKIADVVIQKVSECYICGGVAHFTKALIEKNSVISVGGSDKYVASCEEHHKVV